MVVHKTLVDDGKEIYILYDDDDKIVELPTRFVISLGNSTRYSPKSVPEYLKDLKYFCQYIKTTDQNKEFTLDVIFEKASTKLIHDYFQHLRKEGKTATTIRRRDAVLRTFFDWLTTEEAGRIREFADHPYSNGKYKTPSLKKRVPKFITHLEVSNFILHGFENESERCIAHFLFDTGARVSEVPRLLKRDLPDLDQYGEDVAYFPILIRGSKAKGGQIKERYSIISRTMINRIQMLHNNWSIYRKEQNKYPPGKAPMFLNVRGGPITSYSIGKKFNRASKHLIAKGLITSSISPHRLRHGCAYSILKSEYGRDFFEKLIVCKENLGHVSITTTEIYTALPAPVLANLRRLTDSNGNVQARYKEADYIFRQTFKKQIAHKEKRGHYKTKQ